MVIWVSAVASIGILLRQSVECGMECNRPYRRLSLSDRYCEIPNAPCANASADDSQNLEARVVEKDRCGDVRCKASPSPLRTRGEVEESVTAIFDQKDRQSTVITRNRRVLGKCTKGLFVLYSRSAKGKSESGSKFVPDRHLIPSIRFAANNDV
jgi:hypothetical protein